MELQENKEEKSTKKLMKRVWDVYQLWTWNTMDPKSKESILLAKNFSLDVKGKKIVCGDILQKNNVAYQNNKQSWLPTVMKKMN